MNDIGPHHHMRLLAMSALALACLCAATVHAAAPMALDNYQVTRPGNVLVDHRSRIAALGDLTEAERQILCGARVEKWKSHKVKTEVHKPKNGGTDHSSDNWAWTVMNATGAVFGLNDPDARKFLITNLRRWARGKALSKPQEQVSTVYYSIDRTLLPAIVGFSIVRDAPELEAWERKKIASWLKHLVRLRGIKRPANADDAMTGLNNHRYLRDSVDMAFGALTGDDETFQLGIDRYIAALGQMRPDGSFPLETARGMRALYYQRHAIASLVTIAEMAAAQGYDLYGVDVDGRSIHDAITYLIDGVEEPTEVWHYAEANANPGPIENYRVQDLNFMMRRGHGRHYMAWSEAYLARFGGTLAGQRLDSLLDRFQQTRRPMIDDYSGGNTSCFYATSPMIATDQARSATR